MRLIKKARGIIISETNLPLLGTNFSYKDYDKFFEKHYGPLKPSTIQLLNEPAEIEYEKPVEQPKQSEDEEGLYDGGENNGTTIDTGTEVAIPDENQTETQGTTVPGTDIPAVEENNVPAVEETGTVIEEIIETPQTETETVIEEIQTTPQTEPETVIEETQPATINTPAETDNLDNIVIPDVQESPETNVPTETTVIPESTETTTEPETQVEQQQQRKPQQPTTTETPEPKEPQQTNEPQQTTEPENTETDDNVIYFDDFGNEPTTPQNNKKNNNEFDLEDEYYDLDGF